MTESFDWLFSFNAPSTATPVGDAACHSPVYIGQYIPGGADPRNCITAVPTKTVTRESCEYAFQQTDSSTTTNKTVSFYFRIECDKSASTLQPPSVIEVNKGGFGIWYIYSGTFKSKLVCPVN